MNILLLGSEFSISPGLILIPSPTLVVRTNIFQLLTLFCMFDIYFFLCAKGMKKILRENYLLKKKSPDGNPLQ